MRIKRKMKKSMLGRHDPIESSEFIESLGCIKLQVALVATVVPGWAHISAAARMALLWPPRAHLQREAGSTSDGSTAGAAATCSAVGTIGDTSIATGGGVAGAATSVCIMLNIWAI